MAIAEAQHLLHPHIRGSSVTTIAPRRQQISRICVPVVDSRNNPPESKRLSRPSSEQVVFRTARAVFPRATLAVCSARRQEPRKFPGSRRTRLLRSAGHEHRANRSCGSSADVYQAKRPASAEPLEFRPKQAESVEVEEQVNSAEVQEHWHDGSPILARKEVRSAGRSESQQYVRICRTSRQRHENEDHEGHCEGSGSPDREAIMLQFLNCCRY